MKTATESASILRNSVFQFCISLIFNDRLMIRLFGALCVFWSTSSTAHVFVIKKKTNCFKKHWGRGYLSVGWETFVQIHICDPNLEM